jgi:hypothetical protein
MHLALTTDSLLCTSHHRYSIVNFKYYVRTNHIISDVYSKYDKIDINTIFFTSKNISLLLLYVPLQVTKLHVSDIIRYFI